MTGYIATIPDSQLTGSTNTDSSDSYSHSKLHTTGAWESASLSVGQFIQADLGTVRGVEKVATQGQSDSDQWVTSYKFAYSGNGITYSFILNPDGSDRVFTGNSDRNTVIEQELETAVAARYVRVYPQTWHEHMAMRWEVYGCDIGKMLHILRNS